MIYLLLGLALGTFVSGLIEKYYNGESGWIASKYLFGLSVLLVLLAIAAKRIY